ncbi:MAG: ThuA domain-containing protein [Lachnospiraceae bacterium]|nr:ThuA domain-containing protein [Lachnospiraceae bacterium]
MLKVTIWNENLHEQQQEEVRAVYPRGIHGCIAEFLEKNKNIFVRTATLEEPEHGLTEEVLADTDVLIYWGHMAHREFSDEVAQRIQKHVLQGMGLIALHSAHFAKIMSLLMGTSMTLRWKHGDRERLFVTAPYHPIAQGIPAHFDIPMEEMYGEYFDIPKPDDVVFTGWFAGGEVFRSGCTFQRGLGRIFYFQPGHEEYPIFHMPEIQQIITNAVYWCSEVRRQQRALGCTAVKVTLEEEYANPMKLSVFYDHIIQAVDQSAGKYTIEDVMKCCSDFGIRGIDIEYGQLCADYDRICEALQYHYMEVASIYHIWDLKDRYDISVGKDQIDMAYKLGVKRVLVVPGYLEEEEARALHRVSGDYRAVERFMEDNLRIQSIKMALTELTQYAKPLGVKVTLEDFDNAKSPCSRMNELLWFMRNIPDLRCTFDMGNFAFGYENVMEAYEVLQQYIVHVHCKDRGSEGNGLKSVPTGSGYIPVGQLVRKLKAADYHGYLSIEHFGDIDQLQSIEQSAHFLKSVLSNMNV